MSAERRLRINAKDTLYLAVVVLAILGVGWWVWDANMVQRVFLVNGLSVPVEVSVDGKGHPVPGQGRVEITLLRGVHQVQAKAGQKVIEETALDVPSVSGVVAYNLLGLAPLYNEAIYYGTRANPTGSGFTFYGGQRLVVAPRTDFVFTTPPRSISVKESSSQSPCAGISIGRPGAGRPR